MIALIGLCVLTTGMGFLWGARWAYSQPRTASGRDARRDLRAAAERYDIDRLARDRR